jgi:uncharacterized protein (DUF1330 family)
MGEAAKQANLEVAMSAFFLFHNKQVRDPTKLAEYKAAVAPVVAAYGGRYRVLGGEPTVVEGDWRPSFLVMIEFPSVERATAWYGSGDYKELKAMRLSAVDSDGVLMTGIEASA